MSTGISRRGLLPLGAGLAGAALAPAPAAAAAATLDGGAGATVLAAGVHRVSGNVTLKTDLQVQPGAVIELAPGATLTILGALQAPVGRIFSGEGRVDLNRSRTPHAHPEWWGAMPGDNAPDTLPALRACMAAHPVMHLLPADYPVSDTLVVDRPFARVLGSGFRGTLGWRGTRLILTNGTGDVLRAGPATRPGSVNEFPQNIDIRRIALCRSMPAAGAAAGLSAQYLLYAHFEQLSANEHGTGFRARGLVRSQLLDCVAFRSLPGVRAGDVWRGFLLDGMDDIGLAGGNASLFLTDCNATIGGDPQAADPVGLLLEGAFADCFVRNFETSSVPAGIRVDGRTDRIGARARNGQVNLHIAMPIIDQCGDAGIEVRDTSPHMMIDISEPYVAAGPRTRAALSFRATRGSTTISGGQLVGMTNSAAGGTAIGLSASDSEGLQVHGLKILDHARPIALEKCAGFALHGWIANPGGSSPGPAAVIADCARGTAQLIIGGQAGAFDAGVRIEGAARGVRIDATMIDARALRGGGDRRVTIGDTPAPVPSRRDTLLIDGV